MPATVQVGRKYGAAPGTFVDITGVNTRMNTQDAHSTNDTTYPIQIPVSGSKYSFWATFRLKVIVSPAGTINNLRFYTDGSNGYGTGVTSKCAKASTGADAGYRQATGTGGVSGTELTQVNHSGLDAAPVDTFSFNAGSPLALAGSISNPATGEFGDHVVVQTIVASTASPGATDQEVFTVKYDET